jgi:pimeloyl-ACP methyl ester carboxylesterase/catechol 2,3-dioxygenase-like lactoylglutathione lyase family enzyme
VTEAIVDVPVGGLSFRTRVAGEGDLVVLLHGYPQSSWEWHAQLPALAAAGYRAVAPDQRGYSPGARPTGVDAYAIDHLVGDVLAIADHFGAERFHVVGHDWGAIVAWHVAAWHPDRVRSLTSVSVFHPAAFARALNDPSTDQAQRSAYMEIFRAGDEASLLGSAERLRAAFDASGLAGHDVDEHVRVMTDAGALEAATNWYRAFDFRGGDLGPVRVPTLFVWGADDPALGPDGVRWTEDHVDAPYRLEVLEDAPHWIPEVCAARLNELLLDHLARVEGQGVAGACRVAAIDHVAITVTDVEATIDWYRRVLGAELLYADAWRSGSMPVAIIRIGGSRLSLHPAAAPAEPHAAVPTSGSTDICFRALDGADHLQAALARAGVEIVDGPVPRPAADGTPGTSVYVRDPDGNLVELLTTVPARA